MISTQALRKRSHEILQKSGGRYEIHELLPPMDEAIPCLRRSCSEIQNRALAMYIFILRLVDGERFLDYDRTWLLSHGLYSCLTDDEQQIFNMPDACLTESKKETYLDMVEGLYALCWLLGKENELNINGYVPDNLVRHFPVADVNDGVPSIAAPSMDSFCTLRDSIEVAQMWDVYYCMHWSMVEERVNGIVIERNINVWTVIERRRALEWALSNDAWDEISLDT
ncbi:DUF4272 domain-containing protein [Stenoxybacter acetivorans]|uniref:DUF4272 domain-containing protein n=1 Tax=Stenoxybacter acetivorans TaxID=422441 RepID=UPI0005626A8B|nr:DUF4272 domain-containing protein [Stenoxybacter acetivorans]